MQAKLFLLGYFCHLSRTALTATPISQFDLTTTDAISVTSFEEALLALDFGNDTTYPDFNISTSLDAYYLKITCLTQPKPPARPTFNRVNIEDYYRAVDKVLVLDNAMTDRVWNLGPNRKAIWDYGGAVLGLQVPYPTASEKFPPIVVAHAAALIARKCVTSVQGYLGGATRFGRNGQFYVIVGAKKT